MISTSHDQSAYYTSTMDICRTFSRVGHCEIIGCLYKHPGRDEAMITQPYANSYGQSMTTSPPLSKPQQQAQTHDGHDGMTSASSWEEAGNYQPFQDNSVVQMNQNLYYKPQASYNPTIQGKAAGGAPPFQPIPHHQSMGLVSPPPQILPYGGHSPYSGVVPFQSPPPYPRKLCRFAEKCRNGDECLFYHPKPHEQQYYSQQQQDMMSYRSPHMISPYQQGYSYQPHPSAMQYPQPFFYNRNVYDQQQPSQNGATGHHQPPHHSHHQNSHNQHHQHQQQSSGETTPSTTDNNTTTTSSGSYITMTADQLIKGTIPSPTNVQSTNPTSTSHQNSTASSSSTTPSTTPPEVIQPVAAPQPTNTPATSTPSNSSTNQPNLNGNNSNNRNNKQKQHHHNNTNNHQAKSDIKPTNKSNYNGPKPNYTPQENDSDKVVESMATAIKQIQLKEENKPNKPENNNSNNTGPSPILTTPPTSTPTAAVPSPQTPNQNHPRKGQYQSPSFDKKNFKTISKPKQYDEKNNNSNINQPPHSKSSPNENGKIKKDINGNSPKEQHTNGNTSFQSKKRGSFPPLPSRQVEPSAEQKNTSS